MSLEKMWLEGYKRRIQSPDRQNVVPGFDGAPKNTYLPEEVEEEEEDKGEGRGPLKRRVNSPPLSLISSFPDLYSNTCHLSVSVCKEDPSSLLYQLHHGATDPCLGLLQVHSEKKEDETETNLSVNKQKTKKKQSYVEIESVKCTLH